MKTNENESLGFAISKMNFIFIAISVVLIILGFFLMTGDSTDMEFNENIFSTRRITIGPMISLFGFISMIFAILYNPKNKKEE